MQTEKYVQNRKQVIIIGIISFIIISIIIIIITITNSLKSATVQILVAPTFAKVEIDNKTYSSSTAVKTYPKDGEFTATISAEGFITQEVPVQFNKDNVSYIYVVLEHETDGLDWYEQQDQNEANRLQEIADCVASMDVEDYVKQYPIATILPYIKKENNSTIYRIDYGKYANCKSNFCLKITDYTGNNKNEALNYIKEHGFNPEDYEIAYENTIQNIKDNPITNYLPYNGIYYLDYSYGMDNQLTLTIDCNQTYFDGAVEKLKNFATAAQTVGGNKTISEYNIQFTYNGFSNPFEGNFRENTSSNPIDFLKNGYQNIDTSQNVQFYDGTVDGNYYYTLITIGSYSEFSQVTFRVVLVKNGDSWRLASVPQPILTTTNTKDIPVEILNKVNNLIVPN